MDLIAATLSSTYLASKSEARADAVRKLRCKQGFKQQGAVCKPIKEGLDQPVPIANKGNGLLAKRLTTIAAIATAGYLGTRLEQSADFRAITGVVGVSPLLMNSDKIDDLINNSPLPDNIKEKAQGVTGATKLALMKRFIEGSGYKLESVDSKNNSFTYRNEKTGDIKTVGSAGSALLIFSSTPANKKEESKDIFRMEFQVNMGYSRNTERATKDATSLIKIANSAFKEHLRLLPDNCIVGCMVADDDGQGKRRENIYKRAGFTRQEGMDLGMDLYAMKVNGKVQKINNPSEPKQEKKDSEFSFAYLTARELARHDAKILVKVPAKNGRKAYSYYREGKEAIDEPEVNNRQTARPIPTPQPQVSSAVSAETEKTANEDLFALMSIRDLKQEARNRGINRYSYMTRDQLQGAIKFHDANPDYKENLIKTVQRQKDLDTLKKVKSSEIGRAISTVNPTLGRQYNLLNAIAKKYEKNPTEALIYALPAILGVTKLAANALKKNRIDNIKESAGAAVNDADKYKEDIDENVSPESVNFFVGGYGRGSKDLYNRVANSPYASSEDKDWIKNSKNIPINRGGEDVRSFNATQKVFNDIATGYNITANNTFLRGKNKESVELAAQLYAHGSKYRTDQDGVRSLRPLQVLASEDGGIVARDALEILDQMPGGKAIAKRVKLVTLGTPYFGESKVDIPEVNLVGDGDPWAALPFNKGVQTKRVSTVSGGSQQDYTASADAMGKVFENMRSGLSDRAVVDKESVKAATRAKDEIDNAVENQAKAARDAALKAERDRLKAEKDKQYEIRWKTILRQQAGNDTKKFEDLEKDINAVYKAQLQADKDIEREKKEQKKLERARRGVKK